MKPKSTEFNGLTVVIGGKVLGTCTSISVANTPEDIPTVAPLGMKNVTVGQAVVTVPQTVVNLWGAHLRSRHEEMVKSVNAKDASGALLDMIHSWGCAKEDGHYVIPPEHVEELAEFLHDAGYYVAASSHGDEVDGNDRIVQHMEFSITKKE